MLNTAADNAVAAFSCEINHQVTEIAAFVAAVCAISDKLFELQLIKDKDDTHAATIVMPLTALQLSE